MSARMELRKREIRRAQFKNERKEAQLRQRISKLEKRPLKLLQALYGKKVRYNLLSEDCPYRVVGAALQGKWKHSRGTRAGFFQFIQQIVGKSRHHLIDTNAKLKAVRFIYHFSNEAIRPLNEWCMPHKEDDATLMHSLIRHMFAKYPVPRFMNQAFTKGNEMHIDWFIRLGRGENLRKVPHLPFAISKKMAHYFVEEQGRRQIEDAFIYGIIRGMGGSRELTRQILANTQYDFYQHPQFWATVFRFLVDHPKLSFDQISPLMDYIHFQKFEPQMRVIRRTQLVSNGPPQPNFEMKGRTVTSLIRAMEKWHEEYRMNTLNRGKEREKLIRWAPVKVRDFKCLVDEGPQSGEYRIVQLLNNWELMDEGKTLGHCVASYVYACTQKRASIWSFFRDEGKKRMTKLLTIEMNNHNRNLVQIRGAHNSRALDWQMEIIHQWVKQEKLKISEWV